ncbi:sensor histidine kinase [Anaerocolumna sedimenticola]|nr:HAMP domain-containing sensor histidine kinase [Anaerocolumna sedimenticola]
MKIEITQSGFLLILLLLFFLSAGIILIYRSRTKKTMDKLNQMLDAAINGSFTENTYDESKLSALEAKLNRYLCLCAVSSKNLAEEKNKIKSLISDISHQTKTPLSNILLYTELLLEKAIRIEKYNNLQVEAGVKGKPEAAGTKLEETVYGEIPDSIDINCVRQIYAQAEKLNFLISVLVKTSRLETGIISVSTMKNSIQGLIKAAVTDISQKAAGKDIHITSCHKDGTASFDMKWSTEAIYNILDNAVKYMKPGGTITITAIPYEMFYRIDITDTGIGIAEEEQNKIFARFYRSKEVNQYEGVGIGLYLAREIISLQGGYIKVKSRIGEGSTFSVFLPI